MAGATVEFTDTNFEQEVTRSSTPVLVDMWAAWCGPCRVIGPVVEELAGAYQGRMKVGKLNVDDHPQVAAQFRVMNIPTLLFFKGGREVDRIVGVVPKEELSRRIEQVLSG
jgi:thioredoxin 1